MNEISEFSELIRPPKSSDINRAQGRISRYAKNSFPSPTVSGLTREGMHFRGIDIAEYHYRFSWACWTESAIMEITQELQSQYDAAADLWKAYEKRLSDFRSLVKNDVASLEASARKTAEAVTRMNKAYGDVIAQMNGQEMRQAVENAERLAAAMAALANLQSHKLTVAVIDNDPSRSA